MAILDLPVIIPINEVATTPTGYHQQYRWYYIRIYFCCFRVTSCICIIKEIYIFCYKIIENSKM